MSTRTNKCVVGLRWASIVAMGALLLFSSAVRAAGTPAGTRIDNTATLRYQLPGRPVETAVANAPAITVAKLLGVAVTWLDAAAPAVRSPDTARPLAFVVTNTGNGTEPYRLVRADALGGDQFDPKPAAAGALWLESGAEPGFQATGPNADTPYIPGVNDPALPPDGSRTVYVLSDIPAGAPSAGTGRTTLTATATTAGAAGASPGTSLGTFGGVQTIAGASSQSSATGWYLVAGVSMGLAKSVASVLDPRGGTRVMTGSVLTYRLVLTFTGTGVAEAVSVSDPLPESLTYVQGSLLVDGSPCTDAADADGASVAGNAIRAEFGSVTAPAQRLIEFKATVN